ncbi:MAG TPA: hypothetical protein VFP59_04250 [Candidatus Angelobacter sp.]|nr:hypothetical protein [Candidatus Angelobacter sp.]
MRTQSGGVVRLEICIHGKKRTQMWNDQIRASITVSAGRHRITLVAVDKYGAQSTEAINVTAR